MSPPSARPDAVIVEEPRRRPCRRSRPALAGAPIEEHVAHGAVPRAARPEAERHGEPHLRPLQDRGGQQALGGLAEHALGRPARELQSRGHRRRELDEAGDRGRGRGSRSRRPCSSGPASSAARPGRSSCPRRAAVRATAVAPARSSHCRERAVGARRACTQGRRRSASSPRCTRSGTAAKLSKNVASGVVLHRRGTSGARSARRGRAAPASRASATHCAHAAPAPPSPTRRRTPVQEGARVLAVAGEELVAAFAGEDDGDVLARELRDEVERHARRMRDRLVLVPHQAGQRAEEVLGADRPPRARPRQWPAPPRATTSAR